jgi:hypothetical protein
MQVKWKMMFCLPALGLLANQLANAQYCQVTNSSLNGPYGYVASQLGTVVTTSTGTGTGGASSSTGAPNTYSSSNIGQLLAGIAVGDQFGYAGALRLDGGGNVFASSAPMGTVISNVGTYNVNPDCSVSISLMDPFGTNTSVTQLAGIVLGRGAEIDLVSPSSLQSPTGAVPATYPGSGLAIKLVRALYQSGCSVSNLTGLYAFVVNPISITLPAVTGTGTTPATTSLPKSIMGYLDFDGTGNIVAVPSTGASNSGSSGSAPSTFASLAFTGSYMVNMDCSATMTITNTGSAPTAQPVTLSFVVTPPLAASAVPQSPGLSLSYFTGNTAGSGYAVAQ